MMFNSSNADLKHFFRRRSRSPRRSMWRSGWRCTRRISPATGRGVQVTSGNALAARLAQSGFDLGIPIHTGTPAEALTATARRCAARW